MTCDEVITGERDGNGESRDVVTGGNAEDEGNKVLGNKGDNEGVELPELFKGWRGADRGKSELVKRGDCNSGRLLWRCLSGGSSLKRSSSSRFELLLKRAASSSRSAARVGALSRIVC